MSDKILQTQRKQTSVTIEGIDTSTPDDLVKDGKCQELHNVRIKDGAWRPVNMHKILHDVASAMGEDFLTQYRIVYHHPAAGEHTYIAMQHEGAEHRFYVVNLHDASATLFAAESIYTIEDIHFYHFGNVLMFNTDTRTRKFLYANNTYEEWIQPEAPIVTVEEGTKTPALPTHQSSDFKDNSWDSTEVFTGDSLYALWRLFDDGGNVVFPINKDDAWLGSLAFFVTYRMEDGSNISISPIGLLSSEAAVSEKQTTQNFPSGGTRYFQWTRREIENSRYVGISSYLFDPNYGSSGVIPANSSYYQQPQLQYFTPTLKIDLPTLNISSIIKSVAVYTTRIYFPFRYSSSIADYDKSTHFHDVKFPEEPFYLCKEIPLSEFKDNSYEFSLTYELLSDITSKRVYSPLNNIHEHNSETSVDYNNRLHLANYTTTLLSPNSIMPLLKKEGDESVYIPRKVVASVKVADRIYNAISDTILSTNSAIEFLPGYQNIISYPDYRCEEILLIQKDADNPDSTYAVKRLTPAVNNNFAYYIVPDTGELLSHGTLRYTPISYNIAVLSRDIDSSPIIYSPNKVIVSQPNNPFAFDFANTYAIGSDDSTVLALQSAAIEMSDAKYGEYPLYAFTTDGIYALQSGENTLYSSVLPINYDKITNKDVLAINYNLVYITSKGVHILNGKGSTLISAPLNDLAGHPLTLLNEVKLLNPESFNEVVFYHEPSSKAYIYNLDFGYWSTRDMSGAVINDGKIVNDRYIIDATEEDVQRTPAECKILTRPIKLGDLEFKRLETIIPRISFLEKDTTEFNFLVQGSNNPSVDWTALRCYHATFDKQGLYPIILRRTPFSSKYIRFAMDVANKDGVGDFTIANVDFEFYHKFLRRMR